MPTTSRLGMSTAAPSSAAIGNNKRQNCLRHSRNFCRKVGLRIPRLIRVPSFLMSTAESSAFTPMLWLNSIIYNLLGEKPNARRIQPHLADNTEMVDLEIGARAVRVHAPV